jgi:UDP-GlcNAc:undecaprenyl-phosphate GlcNAc-1-phosphate transferase
MRGYAIVLVVAALTTFLLSLVAEHVARRIGAIAFPRDRDAHEQPTPLLGGAALFGGFLVAMVVASRLGQFDEMFLDTSEAIGVMLAAGVIFAVGLLDDLREVSPPAKVAGMVLAGSLLSLFGVTMLYFRVPFASQEYVSLSADLAPLVTVVIVVLMATAINLIDGLDGLAAGIVAIAGLAFFLFADRLFKAGLLEGSNIGPLVAIIAVGVCVGFLPRNFNPAKMFMGDSGAMLLGLLMAVTTITVGGNTSDQFSGQTYFFFAPLFIPVVILGVPLLDTAFSFVRRVAKGTSFSVADKDHLHHRLMRLGHGPRRTVVILWVWTALLSAMVLFPTYTNRGNALVPLGTLAAGLLLFIWFIPAGRTAPVDEPIPVDEGEVVDLAARRAEGGRP